MDMVVRVAVFLAGAAVVITTVLSAVESFVVPRAAPVLLTRSVFVSSRWLFGLAIRGRDDDEVDRVMALFAPLTLLVLPGVWLTIVVGGYTALFWSVEQRGLRDAFRTSGSSLLTLGFQEPRSVFGTFLALTAATLGVGLVALLITYLPSMYSAFARRETVVALLEVRAGSPPSAVEMLWRFQDIHGLDRLDDLWTSWERWFADVEESHTSLAALPHFRSPRPGRSWVTAAGAVLDAASIRASALDLPRAPEAELCIRAGFLALRHIADYFGIIYDADPSPTDPVSVSREEFDAACTRLAHSGVPLVSDLDQAWRAFSGWRVNYDAVLLALAALTVAPPAPWSSDRAGQYRRPPIRRRSGRRRI